MKRYVLCLSLILGLLVFAADTFAQKSAGSFVTQTGNRADAATIVGTSTTSAGTITLTPNAGESLYLYNVHITNCAGASAVTAAAVTTMTVTNLGSGTTPVWTIGSGVAAGLCQPESIDIFPTGLKANAQGTTVVFTLPTFATNQTLRVTAYASSAP